MSPSDMLACAFGFSALSTFSDFSAVVVVRGARCFTIRRTPISTVAAVVPAISGKPSIKGLPIANAFDSKSSLSEGPDAVSTTTGTATAIASGGCTMGPKRLFRCTATIAPSALTT
jgi:hypothetical protein